MSETCSTWITSGAWHSCQRWSPITSSQTWKESVTWPTKARSNMLLQLSWGQPKPHGQLARRSRGCCVLSVGQQCAAGCSCRDGSPMPRSTTPPWMVLQKGGESSRILLVWNGLRIFFLRIFFFFRGFFFFSYFPHVDTKFNNSTTLL